MEQLEKTEIINMFIQNYQMVEQYELFMNGISDESADAVCAAALTIIEYLNNKGGQTK